MLKFFPNSLNKNHIWLHTRYSKPEPLVFLLLNPPSRLNCSTVQHATVLHSLRSLIPSSPWAAQGDRKPGTDEHMDVVSWRPPSPLCSGARSPGLEMRRLHVNEPPFPAHQRSARAPSCLTHTSCHLHPEWGCSEGVCACGCAPTYVCVCVQLTPYTCPSLAARCFEEQGDHWEKKIYF